MKKFSATISILFFLLVSTFVFIAASASAAPEEVDQLRDEISNRSSSIQTLEEEIAQYKRELNALNKESSSLENTISSINTNVKKVSTNIQLTQNKIASAELKLKKLRIEIKDKQAKIEKNKKLLAKGIRVIDQRDSDSLIEIMLKHDNISEFWERIDSLSKFQKGLDNEISQLKQLRSSIQEREAQAKTEQQKLLGYHTDLAQERKVLEGTKQEKAVLLEKTENQEARYQSLLQEKLAKKRAFEQDLEELESKLQVALDTSRLPDKKNESLMWPVQGPLTQRFGRTSSSGRLYASGTHNGIDIGIPRGTPIKAAASGTVVGAGDTDRTCQYASYGKWMLIEHPNGLSTLYAHLSAIHAGEGQTVSQGQVIGNSGNTGYSTGPHLHFTTFASQAVKVGTLQSNACAGATYRLPLAPKNGYLDPMEYL